MPNYFAAGSHLQTKDFIGLLIWMCAFIPGILIRPEKLQIPFLVCFIFFCGSCFGLLIWYVYADDPTNLSLTCKKGEFLKPTEQEACSMSLQAHQMLVGLSCSA